MNEININSLLQLIYGDCIIVSVEELKIWFSEEQIVQLKEMDVRKK